MCISFGKKRWLRLRDRAHRSRIEIRHRRHHSSTESTPGSSISLLEVMSQLDRETAAVSLASTRIARHSFRHWARAGSVTWRSARAALDVVLADPDRQVAVTSLPVAINLVPLVDDSRAIEIEGIYLCFVSSRVRRHGKCRRIQLGS